MLKCLAPKRPITRLSFARDETPPGLKPLFFFSLRCGRCSSECSGGAAGPREVSVVVEGFSHTRLQDLHQRPKICHVLLGALLGSFKKKKKGNYWTKLISTLSDILVFPSCVSTSALPLLVTASVVGAQPPPCEDTGWSPCSHSSVDNRWCVSVAV